MNSAFETPGEKALVIRSTTTDRIGEFAVEFEKCFKSVLDSKMLECLELVLHFASQFGESNELDEIQWILFKFGWNSVNFSELYEFYWEDLISEKAEISPFFPTFSISRTEWSSTSENSNYSNISSYKFSGSKTISRIRESCVASQMYLNSRFWNDLKKNFIELKSQQIISANSH